jgi:Predicted transcriptional regulator containing an HTH domain and an uncharacterized domain shared with the mammalian protein Schlafen
LVPPIKFVKLALFFVILQSQSGKIMKKVNPIEALIAQGEHQQLDFKFEVSDSKKIARTLSAFANTDGGRLLIGVKDNGNIAGVRSEEEYYMIEAASDMYTKPSVPFTATRWDINGKTVLEIYIAPSDKKPHTAPDKDNKYKAYIRVDDENILANEVLLLAWKKSERTDGLLLPLSRPVKKLLLYLETHPYINIRQFCRIAHINYYAARNILSDLMAINTLKYTIVDKQIVYSIEKIIR